MRTHTRAHTHAHSHHLQRFWKVVATFTPSQLALLVKFVTSCPRPPMLGFKTLHPPFTLQRVRRPPRPSLRLCIPPAVPPLSHTPPQIPIRRDDERLPSASTCFNTLKLPTYTSSKVMKEKLLFVISSGAGFELT